MPAVAATHNQHSLPTNFQRVSPTCLTAASRAIRRAFPRRSVGANRRRGGRRLAGAGDSLRPRATRLRAAPAGRRGTEGVARRSRTGGLRPPGRTSWPAGPGGAGGVVPYSARRGGPAVCHGPRAGRPRRAARGDLARAGAAPPRQPASRPREARPAGASRALFHRGAATGNAAEGRAGRGPAVPGHFQGRQPPTTASRRPAGCRGLAWGDKAGRPERHRAAAGCSARAAKAPFRAAYSLRLMPPCG
jgi:hypothetical protein